MLLIFIQRLYNDITKPMSLAYNERILKNVIFENFSQKNNVDIFFNYLFFLLLITFVEK